MPHSFLDACAIRGKASKCDSAKRLFGSCSSSLSLAIGHLDVTVMAKGFEVFGMMPTTGVVSLT